MGPHLSFEFIKLRQPVGHPLNIRVTNDRVVRAFNLPISRLTLTTVSLLGSLGSQESRFRGYPVPTLVLTSMAATTVSAKLGTLER